MADATSDLGSGIDMSGFDPAVRAQDDLFSHVNGKWVAETEMPADKARWGTFDLRVENSQKDVRALVAEAWHSVRDTFGVELELEVELVGEWQFDEAA